MACVTEALGLMPLGSATAPATSADRIRIAEKAGHIAVSLAKSGRTPQELLDRRNFENAVTVLQAIGGSTNAIVHLLAVAARLSNVELCLEDFDTIGRRTPLLVDVKPSGANYMEDFHKAGGMPSLLRHLRPLLHMDARTITGSTLGEELEQYPSTNFAQTMIKDLTDPIFPAEALVVLKGNLAPDGCVFKQSAAASHLRNHEGAAVVFDSAEDMIARIDSEDLNVSENSVLILRNIGPIGFPGMPEAGLIPIPKKLARAGVKDMLRISDGRMSGTAEGAVILHVSPESAVGGPLALVNSGDKISVSVTRREITLLISQEEMKQRRSDWEAQTTGKVRRERGYRGLYRQTVNQAHQGADFDWLRVDGGV
jgi:dihydroxy-acid dehydratase